jgi:hypothetical protein
MCAAIAVEKMATSSVPKIIYNHSVLSLELTLKSGNLKIKTLRVLVYAVKISLWRVAYFF